MPAVRQPESMSWPLRHNGPCGRRLECWREECRERFPGFATIEVLRDGTRLAYCHAGRDAPPIGDLIAATLS
jgi:hypothetical protein